MVSHNKRGQYFFLASLLLSGLSIRFSGDIYLTEIVFSLYAVKSIIAGNKVFTSYPLNRIPLLLVIWTFANLTSSLLAEKTFTLTLLAVGTVVVFALSLRTLIEFFLIYPDQILNAFLFFIVGRIIGILLNPLPYTSQFLWKFGYGEWFVLLLLTVVARFRLMNVLWLGMPVLIAISLANEARTIAFLCVGVLLMSVFATRRRFGAATLILLSFLPIFSYYGYLEVALGGHLGASEVKRAQLLSNSELGPLADRKEIIFSGRAFLASPVIGYGFDPQVNRKIIEAGYQQLASNGILVSSEYLADLPLHSFLMSALVQGGFFAGVFWMFALFRSISLLVRSLEISTFLRPLSVYISLALIDRILFSPFGAFERLNACFFLSYILMFRHLRASNEK